MGTRKTYTSYSIPHFSVGKTRIAFTPLSSKMSYFETSDEQLQAKLEAHPWFGDKYILKRTEETKAETKTAKEAQPEKANEDKQFSTLADAKEWLSSQYGVSRSNVKTIADAVAIGKNNGVNISIGK